MNEESSTKVIFSINSIIFEIVDLSESLFKISSKVKKENSTKIKKAESIANDVNYEKRLDSNKKFHMKDSSSSSSRAKRKKEKTIKKNLSKD